MLQPVSQPLQGPACRQGRPLKSQPKKNGTRLTTPGKMHEPTAEQYAALAHKGGTAREAGQTGGCTGLSEFKPEQHAAGCLSCPLAGWAGAALRK